MAQKTTRARHGAVSLDPPYWPRHPRVLPLAQVPVYGANSQVSFHDTRATLGQTQMLALAPERTPLSSGAIKMAQVCCFIPYVAFYESVSHALSTSLATHRPQPSSLNNSEALWC